jgi:hypothetical protein
MHVRRRQPLTSINSWANRETPSEMLSPFAILPALRTRIPIGPHPMGYQLQLNHLMVAISHTHGPTKTKPAAPGGVLIVPALSQIARCRAVERPHGERGPPRPPLRSAFGDSHLVEAEIKDDVVRDKVDGLTSFCAGSTVGARLTGGRGTCSRTGRTRRPCGCRETGLCEAKT